MSRLDYFENEKNKSKKIINDISVSLEKINKILSELEKSKNKTDNIINRFEIECFNYNLVDEMIKSKNQLKKNVDELSEEIKSTKINNDIQLSFSIKKIDYMNDILNSSETQLKTINTEEFKDIEKLQLNAIKKGIYDKYILIKSEVDRLKIKDKFDKIQRKNIIKKLIFDFLELEDDTDMKRENLFMIIHEIDEARENIINNKEPQKEYKIIDILADIELFLRDNGYDRKYKTQIKEIKKIKENIINTFTIDKSQLKTAIIDMQKSRLPMVINKKMNKMQKERQKAIAFLTKNGYIKKKIETNTIPKMGGIIQKINVISNNIEKLLKI